LARGTETAVLYVDGSEESLRTIELLRSKGIEVRVIDTRSNGTKAELLVEYGTNMTPLMVIAGLVLAGYDRIREYLEGGHV